MATPYIALIGDLVGSRVMDDREEVQRRFRKAIDYTNDILQVDATTLASKVSITSGDELQGLFSKAGPVIHAMRWIHDRMHPVRVVFGVGRGAISTPLDPDFPGRIDGPCFHRARTALKEARDEYHGRAAFRGFGVADYTLSAGYDLIDAVESRWTDRQREIVRVLKEGAWGDFGFGNSKRHAAGALQVSPSVITESLQASNYERVEELERSLWYLLEELNGGMVQPAPLEDRDD